LGYGDQLLATGIAKRARLFRPGKKICIGDGTQVECGEVFENNPHISREIVPGCIWVHSHKGFRPYVENDKCTTEKLAWKREFKAYPGELFLTAEEKAKWTQTDFVYIEPNIKGWLGPNKDWGFDRWQEVVNRLPGIRWVQGPGRKLDGVEQVQTASFRDACALLSRASLFVGTDGGLHHAAAALGKKAVVVWGGFTHPRNLGYDDHINLHSGVEPCGSLKPCDHCKKAMDRITVEMVVKAIESCCLPR
jgi:ADP-heptose:LPS heptosyltransferase